MSTTRGTSTPESPSLVRSLAPLALDVGVPVAVYYLASSVLGLSPLGALVASSVIPLLRTIGSLLRTHEANPLAVLVLLVNVTGISLSWLSGDPRMVFAKDSVVSSVVGIGIIVSALRGHPVLAAPLRPFVVIGDMGRQQAWDDLARSSHRFIGLLRTHSLIWGAALLLDCVARLAIAAQAPTSTFGWASAPVLVGAIVLAVVVSTPVATLPLTRLVYEQARHLEARR